MTENKNELYDEIDFESVELDEIDKTELPDKYDYNYINKKMMTPYQIRALLGTIFYFSVIFLAIVFVYYVSR